MIRIGIIGWGENGEKIANALHFEIKDTEVIGVATSDPKGRKYANEKMGLKHVFSSYVNLLELHQIDIICVCSEGDMHMAHVEKSLHSGSNIFIDHPFSCNVEECKKLEKILNSYPSYKSTVAFPRRFDTRLKQLQKDIAIGRLGDIIKIECKTYEEMGSHTDISSADVVRKGIFMDLMLQDIDMVRWLTSAEYETVYVLGSAKKYPSLKRQNDADTAIAIARLTNGCMVSFVSSRVIHSGVGYEVKVTGTLGEINMSTRMKDKNLVASQEGKPYYMSSGSKENSYISILKDFVSAVKNGDKIKYKLEDATVATQVAVAMTRSFFMGQEVSLVD